MLKATFKCSNCGCKYFVDLDVSDNTDCPECGAAKGIGTQNKDDGKVVINPAIKS